MVHFPLLQLGAWGDFSQIFTVVIWFTFWREISQFRFPTFMTGSLCTLTLEVVSTQPPTVYQLQFWFSSPDTGSWGISFCLWISAPVSHNSLYLPVCLSNLGSSGLPCVLINFSHLRSVGFLICSAFHIVQVKCLFLSSLYAELKTGKHFFLKVLTTCYKYGEEILVVRMILFIWNNLGNATQGILKMQPSGEHCGFRVINVCALLMNSNFLFNLGNFFEALRP